jgi:ferredoxin
MCQFCMEHGDGKAWYLEARNYSDELFEDAERQRYMTDFVRDFGEHRQWALRNSERLAKLPAPLRDLGRSAASKRLQRSHYGQPVPIEELESVLDITTSIVRVPCPCRYFAGTRDEGYCMLITTKPHDSFIQDAFADYDMGPDTTKFERLTKEEAMALLRRTEDEGLMHSVWTFITPFIAAICNCNLESGCMAMTLTLTHETPLMFKGEHLAVADEEACTGCAACVKHCPFSAITFDRQRKRAVVDATLCYGCGVCRSACPSDALRLIERQPSAVAVG